MKEHDEEDLLASTAPLLSLRLRLQSAPPTELFAALWRQWEENESSERCVRFLRTVAAGGLDRQLRCHLLLLNAEDVLAALTDFVGALHSDACELSREDISEMTSVWSALVEAAALTAIAADTRRDLRRQRVEEALDNYKAAFGRRANGLGDGIDELLGGDGEDQTWREFEAIPFEIDASFKATKVGRAIAEGADRITHQQHREIRALMNSGFGHHDEERPSVEAVDALWKTAFQLMRWLQGYDSKMKSDVDQTPSSNLNDECFNYDHSFKQKLLLCSDEELEGFLCYDANIGENTLQDISVSHRERANEAKQTPVQKLLEYLSVEGQSEDMPSLVGSAIDELLQDTDLSSLCIKISYLLAVQLESAQSFVNLDSEMAATTERQIQRIINSLTDDETSREAHMKTLLVLSVFAPDKLIASVVQETRESGRHHAFYADLLQFSPLLIKWVGKPCDAVTATPAIIRALRLAILDAAQPELYETQSPNIVAFLLLMNKNSSAQDGASLLLINEIIEDIFIPTLTHVSSAPSATNANTAVINILLMVHRIIETLMESNPIKIGNRVVLEVLQFTVNSYNALEELEDITIENVRQREALLLFVKDLLDLRVSLYEKESETGTNVAAICKHADHDTAFETLVAVTRSTLPSRLDTMSDAADGSAISAKSLADTLLWALLWSSIVSPSSQARTPSAVARLWKSLDSIASKEFSDARRTIPGAKIIQLATASVLLKCGEQLFGAYRKHVLPFLMKYEPVDPAMRGGCVLSSPSIVHGTGIEPGQSRTCFLMSTHAEVRYLVKCWTQASLSTEDVSGVMLVEFLRHVVGACDSVVESSSGSHLLILACFQLQCLVSFTIHELKLDEKAFSAAVCSLLEMSILRSLHKLAAFKSLPEDEKRFVRGFITGWLAIMPPDEFLRSVFQHLAINGSRTRRV